MSCPLMVREAGDPEGAHISVAAYRLLERFSREVASFAASFFWKLDRVYDCSLTAGAIRFAERASRRLASGSALSRFVIPWLGMLVCPYGEVPTLATGFGLVLALACLTTTETAFLLALALIPATLWLRVRSWHKGGGWSPDMIWLWPGPEVALPLAMTLAFMIGATWSSVVPRASAVNLALWCFYLLCFLASADASARGGGEKLVWPALTAVTASSLLGLYQYLRGSYTPSAWVDVKFEGEITRVVGTFTNPTFFAEMIGLVFPLTLALVLKRRDIRDRLLLGAYAALQAAALVFTFSRGGWVGFLVSFCLLAVLYERRLLLVGALVVAAGVALGPRILLERFLSSFSLADSSNSYRVFIWRGSLALLRSYLFRGVGLGAESFVKIYPEYMIIQTPAPHAHSTYLEMLIELGLFGFLALAWFFLAWARQALGFLQLKREGARSWNEIALPAGAISAVVGHMAHGLVEHTWYSPRITAVFWAYLGIVSGIAVLNSRVRSPIPR